MVSAGGLSQVHVFDVCQALWHVTTAGEDGAVYNLADANDTSASSTRWLWPCAILAGLTAQCRSVDAGQGKINAMLEAIFGIRTGFLGKLVSNLARMRLADVVDDANDKHMQPWADLCAVRSPPPHRGGNALG